MWSGTLNAPGVAGYSTQIDRHFSNSVNRFQRNSGRIFFVFGIHDAPDVNAIVCHDDVQMNRVQSWHLGQCTQNDVTLFIQVRICTDVHNGMCCDCLQQIGATYDAHQLAIVYYRHTLDMPFFKQSGNLSNGCIGRHGNDLCGHDVPEVLTVL